MKSLLYTRSGFVAFVLLACLLTVSAPPPAPGQETEAPVIVAITYEGLTEMTPAALQGLSGINVGDVFRRESVDQALQRLIRTGRFVGADFRTEERAGGVVLTFVVRERPSINSIQFIGNENISDRTFRKLITVQRGDLYDRWDIRESIQLIVNKYREKGYGNVSVTFDEDALESDGVLIFRVNEGLRVRIDGIHYEGVKSFSEGKLTKQINSRTAVWIFRSGVYDEDQVEGDVASLRTFYRSEGYLDAQVSYRTELTGDPERIKLVFLVEEGARYEVERIEITGFQAFGEEEIRTLLTSEESQTILQRKVEADVKSIQELYGEYGYIYADVQATRVFSTTPKRVVLTFDINEREQFRVGRVIVRGNTRTRDKVARRQLDLYPPDDLWNIVEARDAEKRLKQTRVFQNARILPVGNEPGVRDVLIDVEEVQRAGDFIFGAGVTSNNGVVGNVVLNITNFDLYKPPRNFSEFIHFKSFFGGGQRLRLELQPGTEVTRARIDFTEPFLFDRPLRLSTSAYLFTRGRDGYDEERQGFNISFGKRFQTGWFRKWSGEVALRVENVDISDTELFAARDINEVKGGNLLTSLRGTLVRDRTDNQYLPTKGDRIRVSYEQTGVLGGEFSFGKLMASYSWLTTLHRDLLDRPHVLQISTDAGVILGDVPIFERFYAGGIGSVRGFAYRGIGPRMGLEDNNVGGEWMLSLSTEYSFPLVGEYVRGLAFIDTGTVESGYRASAGVGVRMVIEILGPVPLEFDLGIPFLTEDGDEEQSFAFFIGTVF